MIIYRLMRATDSLKVHALINTNLDGFFSLDTIEYFISLWPQGQFVAEDLFGNIHGALIGSQLANGRANISLFAVDLGSRGQGVGSKLYEMFRTQCYMQGYSEIQLELRVENVNAFNFYSKRGFQVTERIDSLYGPGEDGIRMVSRLNPINHASS